MCFVAAGAHSGQTLVPAHQGKQREAPDGHPERGADRQLFHHSASNSPKYQPETPPCLTKYPREVVSTTRTTSPARSGRT